MVTKFGHFKKPGPFHTFQFILNCTNFLTIVQSFENVKNFFLNIPSNPLPFAMHNSLTNQFYQKIEVSENLKKKRHKFK